MASGQSVGDVGAKRPATPALYVNANFQFFSAKGMHAPVSGLVAEAAGIVWRGKNVSNAQAEVRPHGVRRVQRWSVLKPLGTCKLFTQ